MGSTTVPSGKMAKVRTTAAVWWHTAVDYINQKILLRGGAVYLTRNLERVVNSKLRVELSDSEWYYVITHVPSAIRALPANTISLYTYAEILLCIQQTRSQAVLENVLPYLLREQLEAYSPRMWYYSMLMNPLMRDYCPKAVLDKYSPAVLQQLGLVPSCNQHAACHTGSSDGIRYH